MPMAKGINKENLPAIFIAGRQAGMFDLPAESAEGGASRRFVPARQSACHSSSLPTQSFGKQVF